MRARECEKSFGGEGNASWEGGLFWMESNKYRHGYPFVTQIVCYNIQFRIICNGYFLFVK